eukprot:6676154-Karenia_brevis.AAC.1
MSLWRSIDQGMSLVQQWMRLAQTNLMRPHQWKRLLCRPKKYFLKALHHQYELMQSRHSAMLHQYSLMRTRNMCPSL